LGRSQASKMMAKDLKDRSKVDEIVLTVVEKGEPREFQSKWSGSSGRVCDAVGKDEEGANVNLTLWNDDIDRVQIDARIKITNGWVSSYKNQLQVSTGKFGKLDIIEE
jgi:replication factor A1